MQILGSSLDQDVRIFGLLKRLFFENFREHAITYLIAMALSIIVAGTAGAIAFLIGDVVNDIFVNKDFAALIAASIGVVVVFVVRGLATFGQAVLIQQISNAIVLDLQVRLFRKALSKEPSFYGNATTGEMMTVINSGAKASTNLVRIISNSVLRDLLTLVAVVSVLFIKNFTLALGIALTLPVIAFLASRITSRVRSLSRRQLEVGAGLTDRMRAALQGLRVVKAFGLEQRLGDDLERFADERRRLANKQTVISSRLAPLMELAGGLAIAAGVAIGGWRIIEGSESPGDLISFLLAAVMAYDPAKRLGQVRAAVETHLVGVRMMYSFLDETQEDDDRDAPAIAVRRGEIRFENVDFAYEADAPVLRSLNLTIPAGKMTAIVGQSGGGKTTIANLLMQYWRPDSGRILIDGIDIAAVSKSSLRSQIAYVGQNSFLFDGTIAENIRVGATEATDEAVIEAAKAAGAHAFISAQPKGYETRVGELGGNLSGGQQQRIAIARAFIRDARIVLLDEPTASLDTLLEREIQHSLQRLAADRTAIIIAHRLSTLREADQILVLKDGALVETGNHEELISKGGLYAKLYAA